MPQPTSSPHAVRSVLFLEPRPGGREAIVDYYRRHDILSRSLEQPGCLAADLQVPQGDAQGAILVTALWESPEAYQGWVDNPIRAQWAGELADLVEGGFGPDTRGGLYDVLISEGRQA